MNQTFLDKSANLIKLSKLPECAIKFLNHFDPPEIKTLKVLDLAAVGFLNFEKNRDGTNSSYSLKYYLVLSDGLVSVPYSRIINKAPKSEGMSVMSFIKKTGAKDKMIGLIQIFKNEDEGKMTTLRATVMLSNDDINIPLLTK